MSTTATATAGVASHRTPVDAPRKPRPKRNFVDAAAETVYLSFSARAVLRVLWQLFELCSSYRIETPGWLPDKNEIGLPTQICSFVCSESNSPRHARIPTVGFYLCSSSVTSSDCPAPLLAEFSSKSGLPLSDSWRVDSCRARIAKRSS